MTVEVESTASFTLAIEPRTSTILKTALSPTWSDILQVGALIALRTLLNYLLERELAALDAPQAARIPDR